MMPDFQMNPMPVDKQHRTEAGAQRDHDLDADPGDAPQSLHVRVVGQPHGTTELVAKGLFEFVALPSLAQVRRGVDYPLFDHPREADRNAIEAPLHPGELLEHINHRLGRRGLRSRDAGAFGDRLSLLVKSDGLDSGPADIDRQGAHRRLAGLIGDSRGSRYGFHDFHLSTGGLMFISQNSGSRAMA